MEPICVGNVDYKTSLFSSVSDCPADDKCGTSDIRLIHTLVYTGMADLSDTNRWWFNCVCVSE